ncbi:MAG TPA: pitrilysin family protein [Anaeromyxobacteraceae bacterium]|nr:pitrilysin family protein [Anaeromyxobacteraceae bacterium]
MSRGRRGGQLPAGRTAARQRGWGQARRAVLGNGLTVVTAPAPGLHSAMVALYVRAGSRHESARENGVSHLLEHLLFRGSEGFPDSAAMNAAVEAAGGNLNGMTARDHGCYYTPLHPRGLATGLAVLGDLVRRPLLKDLEVEREIILEEILDEVDARGRDIDPDNLVKRLAFGRHPLGFKIAGTPATIRGLDRAAVRRHHDRLYLGSNLVLAVAGPVRPAEVEDLAGRHLEALPRGRPALESPPPPWPEGPLLKLVGHDDAQVEFTLAFPSPPEQHRDHPVHLCLRRLLDDGLSSRLPLEVVEKRGLAYSLHAGMEVFADAGLLAVDGACAPPKMGRAVEAILEVLGSLAARPVPEEELGRVQRRHRLSLVFSLDSPGDLVGWYGMGELLRSQEEFESRCRRVEAVTPADVQRVARRTFARENLLAVAVGPLRGAARRALERAVR